MEYDLKELISSMWRHRGARDFGRKDLETSYRGLSVKASIGMTGNLAKIPWVSYCAEGQETQKGIYPVLLFYGTPEFLQKNKNQSEVKKIVLAYGISANNQPSIQWGEQIKDKKKIEDLFIEWDYKTTDTRINKYNSSYVYKTYDWVDNMDYETIQEDIDRIIDIYLNIMKDVKNLFEESFTKSTFVSPILSLIKYRPYLTALRTKPFLLLAGISGTGKSRIVKEMAFASCPDVAELRKDPVSPGNYLLVEVKPNWHDSTELLGYESTIKKGYVLTPFVKFLYKAMKHPDVPFFVCLDEMNLAPVEQYFAEYLSILESRKQQADGIILTEPLIGAEVFRKYPELCAEMNGTAVRRENVKNTYMTTDPAVEYVATEREYENLCEEGLRIPQNVVVIGTVNMDETTHQFSRKVIDRAMTIEMNEVKFDGFFESSNELSYANSVLPKEYFLPCYTTAGKALESVPDDAEHIKANVPALLEQLNEALADTPFKIAYRVQNELVLYFAALRQEEAHKATGTAELLATAMDQILMMKVLPRIEGDDELLEEPLERLAVYAEGYPMASAKIKEMQERLGRSHFTSFWP